MKLLDYLPLILVCVFFVGVVCLAYFRYRAAPISREKLCAKFVDKLRAAAPGATITVKSMSEIHIRDAQGKESTAFLDNLHAEYNRSPRMRQELLRRHVATQIEGFSARDSFDTARIVPIIKDRGWTREINRGLASPLELVFDDFNDELVVVYAEDNPTSMRYLTPKLFQESGFARTQLRDLAIHNLRQLLPEPKLHIGPLVSMISVGGDYEASLLLVDHLWSGGQIKVDGDIVVAVPSRELLLFTGSRNTAGIAKLNEMATQSLRESRYGLTDTLFVYRNGKFEKLT